MRDQLDASRTAHQELNKVVTAEKAKQEKKDSQLSEMEVKLFSLQSMYDQTMIEVNEMRASELERRKELASLEREREAKALDAEKVEEQLESIAHELEAKCTAEEALIEALKSSRKELETAKKVTASAKEWGVRAEERHKAEVEELSRELKTQNEAAIEALRSEMAADRKRLNQMDKEIARVEKTARISAEAAQVQGEAATLRAKALEKKLGEQSQKALHDALKQNENLKKKSERDKRDLATKQRRELASLRQEWAQNFEAQVVIVTAQMRDEIERQRHELEDYRQFAKATAARERRKGMRGGPVIGQMSSVFIGNHAYLETAGGGPSGRLHSSLTNASRVFTPSGSSRFSSGAGANGSGMEFTLDRGVGSNNLFSSSKSEAFEIVLPPSKTLPNQSLETSPHPPTMPMTSPYLTKQTERLDEQNLKSMHGRSHGRPATTPLQQRPRTVR